MNGNIFMMNIKDLQLSYIIHLVLNGIIIIFNFILIIEISWINNLYYYIYLSMNIFGIFYYLIPIIPISFIKLNKLTKKKIIILKTISLIFCFLVYIIGLCFGILLMMNTFESTNYCRECPFNLKDSYINNIYDDYINKKINENKLKELCINRRCIFNNNIPINEYSHEYLCNYDPTKEYGSIKNSSSTNDIINQIECIQIEEDYNKYNFEKEEIYKYMEMCDSFDEFFICQRISEPLSYSLKEDFICPKSDYTIKMIIFCIISITLNIIISYIPWRIEYIKYKNIILSLNANNRNGSRSLNSTQDISKIQKEEFKESFKKEPTETIIVCTEENMINKINKIDDNIKNNNDNKTDNKTENNPQLNNTDNKIHLNNNEKLKKEEINTIKINNNLSKEKEEEINNKIININNCKMYSSERNLK